MANKKRFDYSVLGLVKKNHVTTFNGIGIDAFTREVRDGLANEGYFTKLTRSLAGKEKFTNTEKISELKDTFDMLKSGKLVMGTKSTMTPEEKAARQKEITIAAMRAAVANGTPSEKKVIEGIIAKM
jgi:hypothetical protein